MEFVFVRTVEEVIEAAFGKGRILMKREPLALESRL